MSNGVNNNNLITIIIAVVHLLVIIFYLAWKIPTKEDFNRLENRMDTMNSDLGKRIDNLNQNYIAHLSAHHVTKPK